MLMDAKTRRELLHDLTLMTFGAGFGAGLFHVAEMIPRREQNPRYIWQDELSALLSPKHVGERVIVDGVLTMEDRPHRPILYLTAVAEGKEYHQFLYKDQFATIKEGGLAAAFDEVIGVPPPSRDVDGWKLDISLDFIEENSLARFGTGLIDPVSLSVVIADLAAAYRGGIPAGQRPFDAIRYVRAISTGLTPQKPLRLSQLQQTLDTVAAQAGMRSPLLIRLEGTIVDEDSSGNAYECFAADAITIPGKRIPFMPAEGPYALTLMPETPR